MNSEKKKRKGLVIFGLGLTLILLVLGGIWLWMDRDNIAWRATDARFAKYRELYAAWDKTCPDGLETNAPLRAGLALIQPDALECRFHQVSILAPEDWPDGPLEHRIEIASLASKLYIMTREERWLVHRPCDVTSPLILPSGYIFNIGEELIPALYRQSGLMQLPTHFITIKENFFDCTIVNDDVYFETRTASPE